MLTEKEATALEESLPKLKAFLDEWVQKMQSTMMVSKSDFVSGFHYAIQQFIKKEIEENQENKEYLIKLQTFRKENTGENLWNASGALWPKYWKRFTLR